MKKKSANSPELVNAKERIVIRSNVMRKLTSIPNDATFPRNFQVTLYLFNDSIPTFVFPPAENSVGRVFGETTGRGKRRRKKSRRFLEFR